jgi:hypothetical protein
MKMFLAAAVGLVLVTTNPVGVSGRQILSQVQEMSGQGGRPLRPGVASNPADRDSIDAYQSAEQAKLQKDDRQKQLEADTDKLLALATDLKAQVDKSTKDTLSVDVIKKADEIEKLAHSMKERIKG